MSFRCAHCHEELVKGDLIVPFNDDTVFMHRNCALRGVIGSVAHVQGRCSCYVPGADETDPPELTTRQAANLAVEIWEEQMRLRIKRIRRHVSN